MTVKELKEKLERFDDETRVEILAEDVFGCTSNVSVYKDFDNDYDGSTVCLLEALHDERWD